MYNTIILRHFGGYDMRAAKATRVAVEEQRRISALCTYRELELVAKRRRLNQR